MTPFSRRYGTIASTVIIIALGISLLITGANSVCKRMNDYDDKHNATHEARR